MLIIYEPSKILAVTFIYIPSVLDTALTQCNAGAGAPPRDIFVWTKTLIEHPISCPSMNGSAHLMAPSQVISLTDISLFTNQNRHVVQKYCRHLLINWTSVRMSYDSTHMHSYNQIPRKL